MAHYTTYTISSAPPSPMRKWLMHAFVLSLLVHAGVFAFIRVKKLDSFSVLENTPVEPRVVMKQVKIDDKLLNDIGNKGAEKPKPTAKADILIPLDKPELKTIEMKPQITPEMAAMLQEKPKVPDLANIADSAPSAVNENLNRMTSELLKSSERSPNQPVVTMAAGGGSGLGGSIPGLKSIDDALNAAGGIGSSDRVGIPGGALFEYDKADLRNESVLALHKLGELIKRYPTATVVIEGHSDSFGGAEYNKTLSLRRADSVKMWLVQNLNIQPERIVTVGFGSEKLIVDAAKSVEEQASNRRVEIVIKTNQ